MKGKVRKHHIKKPTTEQITRFWLNTLIVVVGNFITATGAALFILPNNFAMGGTTGLGIFVKSLIPETVVWREWAVQGTIYLGNIILFVIGVIFLGKKFAAATLAGTLLYPTFASLLKLVSDNYVAVHGYSIGMGPTGGPFLCACMGALLFGGGIGIVMRVGASTGGTDIPPLILQKYFGTSVSVSLWIIDSFVILIQFFSPEIPIENILYGVAITLINSLVMGKISPIGMRRTEVKIVSKHYAEIRDMILNDISRGVTVLYGQTGYLKEDCRVVLTVISHRQLVPLKAAVQKIDPEAFMTISVVSEVRGRGFHSDGVDFLMYDSGGNPRIPPHKEEKHKESHESAKD